MALADNQRSEALLEIGLSLCVLQCHNLHWWSIGLSKTKSLLQLAMNLVKNKVLI